MTSAIQRREDPPILARMQQKFRQKRFSKVLAMIERVLSEQPECRILDAGGRAAYWHMLPVGLRSRVKITLLNYGGELAAYRTIDENGLQIEQTPGDACAMVQYDDGEFDIAHSNSVIEHVGGYVRMSRFADEMRRVGKRIYIQTPNYAFPIDPHYTFPFIHWMPDPVKIWILCHFKVGTGLRGNFREILEQVDSCRMLSGWTFKNLFPDAEYHRERFLGIFTKSHIAMKG